MRLCGRQGHTSAGRIADYLNSLVAQVPYVREKWRVCFIPKSGLSLRESVDRVRARNGTKSPLEPCRLAASMQTLEICSGIPPSCQKRHCQTPLAIVTLLLTYEIRDFSDRKQR